MLSPTTSGRACAFDWFKALASQEAAARFPVFERHVRAWAISNIRSRLLIARAVRVIKDIWSELCGAFWFRHDRYLFGYLRGRKNGGEGPVRYAGIRAADPIPRPR